MKTVEIDVTLLDRELFKTITRKSGALAKFCKLVLIDHKTEDSDGFVKQDITKEERAARVEMPIIGNWREIVKGGGQRGSQPEGEPQQRRERPAPTERRERPAATPPRQRVAQRPPPYGDPDLDAPQDDIKF